MTPPAATQGDVGVVPLTIVVCYLCLGGLGGECHTPGCIFWMSPAPSAEQAERLRVGNVGATL